MKELARTALKQLLRQADRKVAGVAKKMPSLTARHLKDYLNHTGFRGGSTPERIES